MLFVGVLMDVDGMLVFVLNCGFVFNVNVMNGEILDLFSIGELIIYLFVKFGGKLIVSMLDGIMKVLDGVNC